jgi:hypothetical protein
VLWIPFIEAQSSAIIPHSNLLAFSITIKNERKVEGKAIEFETAAERVLGENNYWRMLQKAQLLGPLSFQFASSLTRLGSKSNERKSFPLSSFSCACDNINNLRRRP